MQCLPNYTLPHRTSFHKIILKPTHVKTPHTLFFFYKLVELGLRKQKYMKAIPMESSSCGCVKLYGQWASSYTHRVQLALKLKSVEFEYIEEDLASKSPSLLLYNPVYNKVPVLVHDERPMAESTIIIQYIDETWTTSGHPLLPSADPYERAIIRFWSHFVDDKLGPSVGAVFQTMGEEQKTAVDAVHKNLTLLEDQLEVGFFKGRRFFGGEKIGLLDIVVGCGSYWLWVFEEVAGVKLLDSGKFPRFHTWVRDFEEQKEVKETIPASDKLLDYAKALRQMIMAQVNPPSST